MGLYAAAGGGEGRFSLRGYKQFLFFPMERSLSVLLVLHPYLHGHRGFHKTVIKVQTAAVNSLRRDGCWTRPATRSCRAEIWIMPSGAIISLVEFIFVYIIIEHAAISQKIIIAQLYLIHGEKISPHLHLQPRIAPSVFCGPSFLSARI